MRTDEAEAYASTASTGKGGRNLPGTGVGAEVRTAAVGRTKPGVLRLMEAAVERSNMLCAYERVVKNKGAPGVDGLTVAAFKPWLQAHWPRVRQVLLAGEYMPAAVRKVEIPKPQGGVRTLGIPTVLDRMIQQALHQVMQPLFEPEFCESSYGFRPGRSAHQAVKAARGYVAEGRRWTVDLDLEKFFDLVNHDVLMARVARKVKDERVLKLIRRYLEAGLMEGGVVSARTEGTPQGGPLSPLLSNILLTDLDRELEKRGYRFCRYADDCNIYVRSERAGQRVMASVSRFVERKLKLVVNRAKSAVARPAERKCLGYRLTADERGSHLQVAPTSVARFREKVREVTRRRRGVSLQQVLVELRQYAYGWLNYFRYGEWNSLWRELDGWVRRRVRQYQWVLWKNPRTRRRELHRRGVTWQAAGVGSIQPWLAARLPAVQQALSNQHLAALGCPCLATRRAELLAR